MADLRIEVVGDSMEPTLSSGDAIRIAPPDRRGVFTRGDVVVFRPPRAWIDGQHTELSLVVKRIIGIPGDRLQCCNPETGYLEVNGKPLDEARYLKPGGPCAGPARQDAGTDSTGGCMGWGATVPARSLFVMGDNRLASADSSYFLCSPTSASGGSSYQPNCEDAFVPFANVVGVWSR